MPKPLQREHFSGLTPGVTPRPPTKLQKQNKILRWEPFLQSPN